METIFFATFETPLNKSDRRRYNDKEKTLYDFHLWIEEMRRIVRKETKQKECIVKNIQFIQK